MCKKIISIAACCLVAVLSVVPASALSYTKVSNEKINRSDTLKFYTYGVSETANSFIILSNDTQGNRRVDFKDCVNSPKEVKIIPTFTYTPFLGVSLGSSGGYGGGTGFEYENVKGNYEVIRIKLSDYSSYFNSDGSYTDSVMEPYGTHKYTFEEEAALSNGDQFTSALCFESGGAFTCAVPNSKGEVEIHVSKEIGVQTYFSTDFRYKIGSTVGGGGGVNHRMIKELTKGDVNADWSVDIYDAIEIQKAVVGKTKFDKAAKRRGEVNNDSTLDILDATCIQKYLVK